MTRLDAYASRGAKGRAGGIVHPLARTLLSAWTAAFATVAVGYPDADGPKVYQPSSRVNLGRLLLRESR